MNRPKINLREINIKDKTDRLMVWNSNRFNFEKWRNEKKGCRQFCDFLWQPAIKPYDLQTKRLWIYYVNKPENKLKYIFEIKTFRPGELPTDPECHNEDCCEENRKFNQRKYRAEGGKIYEYAYGLTLIYEFKKGNSLAEIQKYKHEKSGKGLFVPQPTRSHVYIGSYRELVEDIKTGKIS
ncbi:MAG: hypothetical protein MRERV_22c004 [Mycoplasmataceae bacterium RV_VA103A]|nr:MAG: hypothetical protein MRERV_22c004 [Mycoplasmataceae bacterium RV_VA103A]